MTKTHDLIGLHLGSDFNKGGVTADHAFFAVQVINDHRRCVATLYGDTPEAARAMAEKFIQDNR